MRKDTFKLLVFAGVVAFAVLYGMEMSSKGIEDVNGSWSKGSLSYDEPVADEGQWALPEKQTGAETNPLPSAEPLPSYEPSYYDWDNEYGIPSNESKPIVDRLSGKTAQVLHDLSRSGIKFVVSLFDKVTE